MDQAHGAARLGADEAVEHLLQLAGNGPPVARTRCLVDDHAHVLALLLHGQHLDGGVGVCQRGGLWRCHDQHFGSQRYGKEHHIGNASAGVQQHHVVLGRQRLDDAQELVAHLGGKARVLDHARARQQHRKPARGFDDGVFQSCLAREHVVQRDLGVQVEHHVQVGEAEVSIQYQHALASAGQRRREVG